ncbi:unnamed protein product [Lymnaea stagnalis]|uniref:Uncharacterized protein n=1 Tax=Lymnaea stagnalis TaxID=6523 RepID=A0AAV2HHZ6_LYMST
MEPSNMGHEDDNASASTCMKASVKKLKQTLLAADDEKRLTTCKPPDVINDGRSPNVLGRKSRTPKLKKPSVTKGKQTILTRNDKKILAICDPPDDNQKENKTKVRSKGARTPKLKKPSFTKGKQTVLTGDHKKILTICDPPDESHDEENKTKVRSQGDNTRKRKKPAPKKAKQTSESGDDQHVKHLQQVKKKHKNSAKKSKQTPVSGDDKQVPHPSNAKKRRKGPILLDKVVSKNVSICMKHKSESALHLTDCSKNPGHAQFKAFNNFSYIDLPEPYNNDRQFDNLVKAIGSLVVKVYFQGTSPHRPSKFEKTPYEINGTGYIFSSIVKRRKGSLQCPLLECEVCKDSPVGKWGEITVDTAAHIVFNDDEAKRTFCVVDYDDDTAMVKTVRGVRMIKTNEDNDTSRIVCVTHDLELVVELRERIKIIRQLHEQLYTHYKTSTDNKLVILVSHPHGCHKHVTSGRYTQRLIERKLRSKTYYTQYFYDPPTCPGSSGAPMYRLDKIKFGQFHPHSQTEENSGNCGIVWEEFPFSP